MQLHHNINYNNQNILSPDKIQITPDFFIDTNIPPECLENEKINKSHCSLYSCGNKVLIVDNRIDVSLGEDDYFINEEIHIHINKSNTNLVYISDWITKNDLHININGQFFVSPWEDIEWISANGAGKHKRELCSTILNRLNMQMPYNKLLNTYKERIFITDRIIREIQFIENNKDYCIFATAEKDTLVDYKNTKFYKI